MTLTTKQEILEWKNYALKRIELRRKGLLPGWGKLSQQDYESYLEDIRRHYARLKKDFNERLAARLRDK